MDVTHKQEQLQRGSSLEDPHINVTHINIRQSIFVLLTKLIIVEVVAALLIILFRSLFFSPFISLPDEINPFNAPLFLLLVLCKILITMYILFAWLEEYYEIFPNEIVHKRGILFKKEQRYQLKHIGSIALEQGLWGRIFNYGSIRLYDWLIGKSEYLYLIHNPRKYHQILEELIPEGDKEKAVFREHLVEKE